MQRLEVSGAVRPIYASLGVKRLTEKTVRLCRPDVTLVDRASNEAAVTDTAIPITHNLQATTTRKQLNYQDLAFETQKQWQQNKIILFFTLVPCSILILSKFHFFTN